MQVIVPEPAERGCIAAENGSTDQDKVCFDIYFYIKSVDLNVSAL